MLGEDARHFTVGIVFMEVGVVRTLVQMSCLLAWKECLAGESMYFSDYYV